MSGSSERKRDASGTPPEIPAAIARAVKDLRQEVLRWRGAGQTLALVPTMGALHDGHMALVSRARREADRTVVSIFVNPAQFSPAEDLDRYPRTFEADCARLAEAGVDLVYAPGAGDMYPAGFDTRVAPGGPALVGLEDLSRPHFFGGVATVVAKLLVQVLPDCAIFGEKDYQQLLVVRAMVRDLDIPVEIVAVETLREADGLAMSSRNSFLSPDERRRAGAVSAALVRAAAAIRSGTPVEAAVAGGRDVLISVGAALDYFEARDAATLHPVEDTRHGPVRLLAAARFGEVRLIDNIAV